MLHTEEPASLLSVWGSSIDDVWVVGGRSELSGAPAVLRYQDGSWRREDPGVTGVDLWWVFGFPDGGVFFGGSEGTILRYRGSSFERMQTPRAGTIFGMWGASADDLWAVGDGGLDAAIVWHFDGSQWMEVAQPAGVPRRVFKVHGRASDDVWMSCADGSALRWNGATLERQLTGATSPLFSIATTPERVFAVGGVPSFGEMVEQTGAAWEPVDLNPPVAWRGLAARARTVFALGESGVVARLEEAGWAFVEQTSIQGDFHAAWIDPEDGLWSVGGAFNRTPLTTDGFITYFGARAIAPLP